MILKLFGVIISLYCLGACGITRDEWYQPTTVIGEYPTTNIISPAYATIDDSTGCAFGGMNAEFGYPNAYDVPTFYYNDLYCLDFSDINNMIWSKKSVLSSVYPSGRSLATGASYKGNFLVFGGINQYYQEFDELWEYDFVTSYWRELPQGIDSPGPRLVPSIEVDEELGLLYLEGGMIYNFDFTITTYDDVWVYKFQDSTVSTLSYGWTQIRETGASKTWIASSTLLDNTLYTFGGEDLISYTEALFDTRVIAYDIDADVITTIIDSESLLTRVDTVGQMRKSKTNSQFYLYGGFVNGENTCRWQTRQGTSNQVVEVTLSIPDIQLKASNNLAPFGHRRHGSFVSGKDLIVFSGFGCDTTQSTGPAPPIYYSWNQIFIYRM